MHVDPTYISRAKKINEVRPDLFQKMWHGELEMKDVKYIISEDGRQQMREADRIRVASAEPLPVDTKYSTIVIDPPWDYEREGFVNVRVPSVPYATMSMEEIAALPVGDLAARNCHLYLWTTKCFLRKSYALLDAWGFRDADLLTWVKSNTVLSHYFLQKCEYVIFAVRGSLAPKRRNATNLITGAGPTGPDGRKLHSSKPEEFYKLVESFSPGPWLEMFARKKRPGWDYWPKCKDVPVLPGAPSAPDFERGFRAKVLHLG
jgi:N6-adenosine-specific RNA methylase IME4